jgi:cellobiose-specific phosphotransferase system component IIC
MPPKIAKLVGLGAFAACAGLLALFLFLVFLTRPARLGGIDGVNAAVTWISLGGLFAALIVAHVAVGKQLLRLSRGATVKHPL